MKGLGLVHCIGSLVCVAASLRTLQAVRSQPAWGMGSPRAGEGPWWGTKEMLSSTRWQLTILSLGTTLTLSK